MQKWLIAVTAGRWQKHGILEAKKAGLKVLALDADPNAEGLAVADHSLVMDLSSPEPVVAAIRALKLDGIAGAVSFCSEVGMLLASQLREAFDLPGLRPSQCRRFLDKGEQRSLWQEADVPGPQFIVCQDGAAARRAIATFGFPCIIKPTDSSGSRGVTKLETTTDDLETAIRRAFEFSRSGAAVVETFMEGTEFTVEVLAVRGKIHVLAVTEKKKVPGTRGTVAYELATPARPQADVDRLSGAVVNAFEALEYRDGPGHAEVILMKDGSVGLVEVAARGGGFMVFDKLVPAISGVNLARVTALQATDSPFDEPLVLKGAAVLRFFPSRAGTLRTIRGFDQAVLIPGVEAAAFVKPGDKFSPAIADGDRMGYILSRGANPDEAQARADLAESKVVFEFAEPIGALT